MNRNRTIIVKIEHKIKEYFHGMVILSLNNLSSMSLGVSIKEKYLLPERELTVFL